MSKTYVLIQNIKVYSTFRKLELEFISLAGIVVMPGTRLTGPTPRLHTLQPGDIVLSRVISLGDAGGGYLLTTTENSLRVVKARSEARALVVPVSWTEMQGTASYSVIK